MKQSDRSRKAGAGESDGAWCGFTYWKFEEVPNLRSEEDGHILFGETDDAQRIVKIREGLDARSRASTLIHELLHVAESSLGFELGEETVLRVEASLALLIHQNPALFRGIVRDLQ